MNSSALQMIALLWIVHGIADYPLQGDWLANAKNPMNRPIKDEMIWPLAMAQHGGIHALGVYVCTGRLILAALEFAAHILIDLAKCAGKIGYNTDQGLHLLCKAVWVILIAWGLIQ